MSGHTAEIDAHRGPVIEEHHGNWTLHIYDDQEIAPGSKYAAERRVVLTGPLIEREFLYPSYRIWTLLAHWADDLPADSVIPSGAPS